MMNFYKDTSSIYLIVLINANNDVFVIVTLTFYLKFSYYILSNDMPVNHGC